jgi:serine/threonine protein kinase
MGWPTLADYNAAFSAPAKFILAPSLRGAVPRRGPFGMPLPISGGSAFIYDVTLPNGGRKAVRCFSEDWPERRARSRAVCAKLAEVQSDSPELRGWFVDFAWEEDCLDAGGMKVPAMVMDWAEGQTLGQYLEAKHGEPPVLLALRERLAELDVALRELGVVHGDLQTGNIVIGKDGRPRLIDYDGLWFGPGGPGPALESGHPNFQHPSWAADSDPARKDSFPSIVIDLGLAALAARPALFQAHSTGENVLFVRTDFEEPDKSTALSQVKAIPDLATAAELFAGLCRMSVESLPSLEDFRKESFGKGAPIAMAIVAGALAAAGGSRAVRDRAGGPGEREGYVGAYPVFDALGFKALSGAVGRKIEVIGKVREIKRGITKYGLPYVFVNFADWRYDCFKLTIWSEGLGSFPLEPNASWRGRWLSAIGLVDEPFESPASRSTQLSITIQDSSQVRFIEESEALYRLGRTPTSAASAGRLSITSQTASMENIGSQAPSSAKPSNAELLERLSTRNIEPGKGMNPSQISSRNKSASAKPKTSKKKVLVRVFLWSASAALAILLIKACSG